MTNAGVLRLRTGWVALVWQVLAWSCPAQDKLVLLSPHWEGIKTEFERAFREQYRAQTGRTVELDWRDMGGASDDLRFIISEFKQTPESIGIDLFFGGGIDPYLDLKEKGLLRAFHPAPSVLEGVPSEIAGLPLYDPEGGWYGTALSSFGILKNKRVVRQMQLPHVSTWRGLTNPALRGWVGSGDPRNSGATHMVYECILQAYGWKEGWKVILEMAANVRQFDRSGSAAAKACTLGNAAYSVVVDFYGFTQIAEAGAENMDLILPSGESILNPDCIAILKGAPHPVAAQKFVEFVLSESGQCLWLAPLGHPRGSRKFAIERMAIRPKLYEDLAGVTLVKTNPFRGFHPLHYNARVGMRRWAPLNALLGALVIDRSPHQRQNVRVPVSEEELNQLADKEWKDPVQRTRLLLAWQKMR